MAMIDLDYLNESALERLLSGYGEAGAALQGEIRAVRLMIVGHREMIEKYEAELAKCEQRRNKAAEALWLMVKRPDLLDDPLTLLAQSIKAMAGRQVELKGKPSPPSVELKLPEPGRASMAGRVANELRGLLERECEVLAPVMRMVEGLSDETLKELLTAIDSVRGPSDDQGD